MALTVGDVQITYSGNTAGLDRAQEHIRSEARRTSRFLKMSFSDAGMGMALLTDSADEVGTSMGTLKAAAGGALSGAAMGAFAGGPGIAVGAAVGGLSGLFLGLARDTDEAGQAARDSVQSWGDLKDALSGIDGRVTQNYRTGATKTLADGRLFEVTSDLGLSDNQAVNAVVKDGKERDALLAKIQEEIDLVDQLTSAKGNEYGAQLGVQVANQKELSTRRKQLEALRAALDATDENVAARRREIHAENDYKKLLRGMPTKVISEIEAKNTLPTIRDVKQLARQYKLTPDQVRTVLEAIGARAAARKITDLASLMKWLNKSKAEPKVDANTQPAIAKLKQIRAALRELAAGSTGIMAQVWGAAAAGLPNPPKSGGGKNGSKGTKPNTESDPKGPARRIAAGVDSIADGLGMRTADKPEAWSYIQFASSHAGLAGSPLEILQAQQQIKDLEKQLKEHKLNNKGKPTKKLAVSGIDRKVLVAQLADAKAELDKLMAAAVKDDIVDPAVETAKELKETIVQALRDQLRVGLFSSGSSNGVLGGLKGLNKQIATNQQWATVLSQLSGKLNEDLLKSLIAEGPTKQAMAMANSIIKSGNWEAFNSAASTLAQQQEAYQAWATSPKGSTSPVAQVQIENFNAADQTPGQIAEQLHFLSQVRS